jgi:hypothetical protein
MIRRTALEQIFLLISQCSQGYTEELLQHLINQQCQMINTNDVNFQVYSCQSNEFFLLLCRFLSFAFANKIIYLNLDQQLNHEIHWLKQLQSPVDDYLLRGHLNMARELIQFQNSERKQYYGIEQALISQIIEQYIFPASTLLYQNYSMKQKRLSEEASPSNKNDDLDILNEPPASICQTNMAISAAFDLLVVLGTDCLENLKLIHRYITELFYTGYLLFDFY